MKLEELTTLLKVLTPERQSESVDTGPWRIGCKYIIRTVTFYYTGTLVSVGEKELVMKDVAWIADTGQFSEALASGKLEDIEPYPDGDVIIGRGAVIDASLWVHALPRKAK